MDETEKPAQKPLAEPKPMTKEEHPIKPFRFLDLPPELRNRVYDYAIPGWSRARPLKAFRLHPLVHTSRQIRKETRQIAASRSKLSIIAWQKFPQSSEWSESLAQGTIDTLADLQLSTELVARFYSVFGDELRFRDISWYVQEPSRWGFLSLQNWTLGKYNWHNWAYYVRQTAVLTFESMLDKHGALGFSKTSIRMGPATRRTHQSRLNAVEEALKAKMSAIATVDGFKGFKVGDMKDVAEALVPLDQWRLYLK